MTKSRAGRKRKPGRREPNGKLSRRVDDKQARRSIDEQAAMQVGKEARQRVFGVSAADSASDQAGTVCGRLCLTGEITGDQLEAAKAFAATYSSYQRAMNSPRPPKAVEIGGITGGGSLNDITPERHTKALKQWDAAKRALVEANIYHRGSIYAACDYFALRDEMHLHMLGDLRVGLNALARHYGLVARRAA